MVKTLMLRKLDRFKNLPMPRRYIFIIDMLIVAVVFFITKFMSTQGALARLSGDVVCMQLALAWLASASSFLLTSSYKGIIRHSGLGDIRRLMGATGLTLLILLVFCFIATRVTFFVPYVPPTREIVLFSVLLLVFLSLSRLTIKQMYDEMFRKNGKQKNVLVYGAGAAGILAKNALVNETKKDYQYVIKAFVDDDERKIGKYIDGVEIYAPAKVLTEEFIKLQKIRQVVIAMPNFPAERKQELTERALELGLQVKVVPHIKNWINGMFSASQIQDINIEDLLQRDPIVLDNSVIKNEVRGKRVMVTGAAGSIGSEICRQLMHYEPAQVILLDQAESPMYDLQLELKGLHPDKLDRMVFIIANVKDRERMEWVFQQFRPELIYHAAAYKHVPLMEDHPYEAIFVNVFGTKNVADLAIKYKTKKFVMISTDKAVNPTNVMGATKRVAEIYTQSHTNAQTHFITTRFGNVLGSNGSVIPLFRKQLEAGGPLTVTDKRIIRFFMTIPEACSLVMEAGAIGEGGDIFVFDMGKPVRIYDLAQQMIKLSGKEGIEIKEIGLRPGEKLYEELLATKENTLPTSHPKIMRAQVRKCDTSLVNNQLELLHQELESLDPFRIVEQVKAMVPEYISNNSVFEKLDEVVHKTKEGVEEMPVADERTLVESQTSRAV